MTSPTLQPPPNGRPRIKWEPPHPVVQDLRDRFERDGFAAESGAKLEAGLSESALEWVAIAAAAGRSAPFDKNVGAEKSGRRRYYSTGTYTARAAIGQRLTLLPPHVTVEGVPYTTYLQPAGANRDYAAERRFEPLPARLLEHLGLQELVDFFFRICPTSIFPSEAPGLFKVGLHVISLQPRDAQAAVSSPNRAHYDGEFVTFILMLERNGIIRGESLIARRAYADCHPDDIPEEGRLFAGTLQRPLDVLATDDRRVSHYVFPVFAAANGHGFRTVLLVDFTPLTPVTSDQRLEQEAHGLAGADGRTEAGWQEVV